MDYCKMQFDNLVNQPQLDNIQNEFKNLLSIKAAAGSGKTSTLAKRYIQILSLLIKMHDRKDMIDKMPIINSIIAITFTNKAAAEMRERIIKFLKALAKIGQNSLIDIQISQNEARDLIINILKNFEDFNVTTIDSFMNTLHKAFAVDIGVLPDYDITFDSEKIFEDAVDSLFKDPSNFDSLINFFKTLLIVDKNINSMDPKNIIKKSLKEYYNLGIDFSNILDPEQLDIFIKSNLNLTEKNTLKGIENRISQNSKHIDDIIKNNDGFNANKIKSYQKIDINKIKKNLDKYNQFSLSEFQSLLKKNSTISKNVMKDFIKNVNEVVRLYKYYQTLRQARESFSIFNQIEKLKEIEKNIKNKLNIVDGNNLTKAIGEILKQDNGVPYAFCRLGEEIMHYLIDEFQDTSREQYNTIEPLLENSISSGGSVFVVGDKKQSIYGWRGGDYTLFDEIDDKYNLISETLTVNYRSSNKIVKFNNFCFGNALLNIDFSEILPNNLRNIEDEIKNIYSDATQELKSDVDKGYVNIHLKNTNSRDEDIDDFYKKTLLGILEKLIQRGTKFSDIMILVRQNSIIPEIVEWIHSKDEFKNIPFITDGNLKIIDNFSIKKILLVASYIINKEDPFYKNALIELDILQIVQNKMDEISCYPPYEYFCAIINLLQIKNDIYTRRFLEEVDYLTNKHKNIREIIEYFYNNKDISITFSEDANAIRIMSIHKAKGLQSKVVIIPCCDWAIYKSDKIYDTVSVKELIENYSEDKEIFIPLNSFLEFSETAKTKYQEKIKAKMMEELNLMYVAQTRAIEELYITGVIKSTKGTSKNLTSSSILNLFLEKLESDNDKSGNMNGFLIENREEGRFFVYGAVDSESAKIDFKTEDNYPEKIYNPESIISRIRGSFVTEKEIEQVFKGQRFGTKIHNILSNIKKIEDENLIDDSIEKAFILSNIEPDENIKSVIKDTIADLKDFFIDIDECWTEKEFVTPKGVIFRIDRLVKKGDEYIIIDYKTGNPDNKDIKQLSFYSKTLPFISKKIIYYTKLRELKNA